MKRIWCWFWGGHDFLWRFEEARMWLECPTCGHETPGWALEVKRAAR